MSATAETNQGDTDYKGCVVNEVKNGSVVVAFTIIINVPAATETPSTNTVLIVIGLNVNAGATTYVGPFAVTSVSVGPVTFVQNGQENPLTIRKYEMKRNCSIRTEDAKSTDQTNYVESKHDEYSCFCH
ncbi:hypothetical protein ACF0H5_020932 [Mactra antiquata]